jgi:hypothetical protein
VSEREVASPSGTEALTESKIAETMSRAERKALKARVLERGIVLDRTYVELPPYLHGEWVPAGPKDNREGSIEVERARALGFSVDTQYAAKRSLHGGGDSVPMVGDCIFMTIPREEKELIDEVRMEQYERMHGKIGQDLVGPQKEERDFRAQTVGLPTPIIEESHTRKGEIAQILKGE